MAKNHAISIGINGYQFASLDPLKYAKSDAELFATFLEKEAKFDQVWRFSDDSPEIFGESTRPYRTPLRRFFRNQFEEPFLSRNDGLWLFFSGHGIQYDGFDYLFPIDGDNEDPEQTAILLNWIVERLRRSGAGEIVLIIDACRTEGRKGPELKNLLYNGITTIFSCRPNESSWEIGTPIFQGSFTHVLLKNLRQQISEHPLTIAKTEETLQQELLLLNRKYGRPGQTPQIHCESAVKVNSYLLPSSFVNKKDLFKEKSSPTITDGQKDTQKKRRRKDTNAFKKYALKAEEENKLDLAVSLWGKVLTYDISEQNSYTKAIKRISDKSALEFFRTTDKKTETQSDQLLTREYGGNSFFQERRDQLNQLKISPEIQNLKGLEEYKYDFVTLGSTDENTKRFQSFAYGLTEEIDGIGIEMILIPGGTFFMGSLEEKPTSQELPKHKVEIRPFLMSKHPITKRQWKGIAKQTQIDRKLKLRPTLSGGEQYPVTKVSWYEAMECCNRLTKVSGHEYRLPTESEWEYACRAGSITVFHFGGRINQSVAQFNADHLAEVCHFSFPNAFGLYDMHGNVWEWCLDHWHPNYHGAPENGSAWIDTDGNLNRIQRGGSWRNELQLCRSAYRVSDHAESRSDNAGFRVVRPL